MWARLDDNFSSHPKILAAGAICELIQVRAICYCARYLTDGFIPEAVVPTLLHGLERMADAMAPAIAPATGASDGTTIDVPSLMVSHRLWEPAEIGRGLARQAGYKVHDFLVYNPSRKQVEEDRDRKREAGSKGAKSRWNKPESPIAGAMADGMAPATGASSTTSHSSRMALPSGGSNAPDPSRPVRNYNPPNPPYEGGHSFLASDPNSTNGSEPTEQELAYMQVTNLSLYQARLALKRQAEATEKTESAGL